MKEERYTIEVSDNFIEIHGDLTIEETFDFLNFFEKKGFKSITTGWENSTLVLSRKGVDEKWEEIRQKEHVDSEKFHENLYHQAQERMKASNKKIEELEGMIKTLFSDESDRMKQLRKDNEYLVKKLKLQKLEEDEEVKKLLQGFAYKPPQAEETNE